MLQFAAHRIPTARSAVSCAATALLALAAAAAPSSAARRPSCATAKGTTLAASTDVRVYRVGASDDRTTYACWLRTARRTTLGTDLQLGDNAQELSDLTLAGRYVGSRQASSTGGEGLTVDVQLTDARTGRTRRASADVTPNADGDIVGGVDSVLTTPQGVALWVGGAADCRGLHALSATGSSTVACGAVGEVAAVGRRVYWQQDGQPRTAVLPAA